MRSSASLPAISSAVQFGWAVCMFQYRETEMKAFAKHVREQFNELDRLAAIWEHIDDPWDNLRYMVEKTADRAARLGLADLYLQTPDLNKLTFRDTRWYLAECLKATAVKSAPNTATLTVTEVARHLKINRDKVLGWINSGKLRAANTAKRQGSRPRYRIKRTDLETFLAGRTKAAEPKRFKRAKCSTSEADVIEFFPA